MKEVFKLICAGRSFSAGHFPPAAFILIILIHFPAFSQESLLSSGPMPGYSEKREVLIWLQTTTSAKVHLEYFIPGKHSGAKRSEVITTSETNGYTASFVLKRLDPGTLYNYEVFVDGNKVVKPYPFQFTTQKLWEWRGDPPEFSFLTGSCAYINDDPYERPGKPYGGDYRIFESMADKKADMMLWLGDNVYLREAEWSTKDGMIYRYSHDRATKELQRLLASMHHYAIWDDHDFGPNDSDRSWRNKNDALEVFKMFWGNPSYGVEGKPGVTTSFGWSDVDFFLLDNRYYRTPDKRKTGERTVLGAHQREWLIDALVSSNATFKIVAMGGQFLNPDKRFENYAIYGEERQWILDRIKEEGITGVIFLTGDRHSSELDIMPREGTYPLHEFTISTFTAGVSKSAEKDNNPFRHPGTLLSERNFAKFTVSGKLKERVIKCTVYNTDGAEKWSYSISEKDVR